MSFDEKAYYREYRRRPEVVKKHRLYMREYNKNPIVRAANRARTRKYVARNKEKIRAKCMAEWETLHGCARKLMLRAKYRAKKRCLPFDLDDGWMARTCNGRCSISGVALVTNRKRSLYSLSLERIDHNKGYTKGNCRWVAWGLNSARGQWSEEEFLGLVLKYADYQKAMREEQCRCSILTVK